MEILSKVLTKLDMATKKDVSQDLKPNQIMKNIRDLQKILRSIQESMNSFSGEVNKDLLFNIGKSSGKSSKQETAEFLLNVNKIGQKAQEGFIIQCIKDRKRFEECIPFHKILNFANEMASYHSIKDCKRDSRSGYQEQGSQYQITGTNQRRPSNLLNALQFDQFKAAVNSFLVLAWQDEVVAFTIAFEKKMDKLAGHQYLN